VPFTTISLDTEDAIATLTLNRPDKLNALNPLMERELVEVFDVIDNDDAIRAVIITGSGRAFCAGADLSAEGAGFDVVKRSEMRGLEPLYPGDVPRDGGGQINLRMFRCLKPVIGAINGAGVGYGATITLPMDVRLASENAKLGFVFARRGMAIEGASSWFLPRAVGMSRALEWTMSGRMIFPDEMLESGLVRSVHPPEELLPAARELAHTFTAETAPVSVALNRQLLWQMQCASHPMEAHRMESIYILARARTSDAAEGVAAFLEKRPAQFPNTISEDMPRTVPTFAEPTFERRRNDPA
jgi:enoyl-CoA hydratase/carnithine racemase